MIRLKRSEERGRTKIAWLDSRHSFSFGEYYDPESMGFRSLRVINEDWIGAGQGFPTHPHRNMEIVTYVVSGEIAHKDSSGGEGVIAPGDVQRMSAGKGVRHSEFNNSPTQPVHLLQIWILPSRDGIEPGYEQKRFGDEAKTNQLCLVASLEGKQNSLTVHQDASVYASILEPGKFLRQDISPERGYWLQLISGGLSVNAKPLQPGDSVALTEEESLDITAGDARSEFLLFDLG